MKKFKQGELVIHKSTGCKGEFIKYDFTVGFATVLTDTGTKTWAISNIRHIEKPYKTNPYNPIRNTPNMANTKYTFNSSVFSDIDWKLIKADLSKSKPIALVTVPIEGAEEKRIKSIKLIKDLDKLAYKIACKKASEGGLEPPDKICSAIPVIDVETRYIAIHASLRSKAVACGIALPNEAHNIKSDIFKISEQFSIWVDWAKRVKSAPWPKNLRNKVTVTIQQIEL